MDTNNTFNQMPSQPTPINTSPILPPKMDMQTENKSEIGPIIATVIIIAIIVLGGLYFWGKRLETEKANQAALQSAGTTTETASAIEATQIETVSQDDSVKTLQNEIQSTNTSNLNSGL